MSIAHGVDAHSLSSGFLVRMLCANFLSPKSLRLSQVLPIPLRRSARPAAAANISLTT